MKKTPVELKEDGQDYPSWMSKADYDALVKKNPHLEIGEVDSLVTPGAKLEFLMKAPDSTAYSASMRFMMNRKDNTNDLAKSQQTMFSFCYLIGEPALTEELANESFAARHQISIGTLIGDAFPMPEAALKKKFRKA